MTFQPEHIGLYFGQQQITEAQQNRELAPVKMAWTWLTAQSGQVIGEGVPLKRGVKPDPILKPALNPAGQMLESALRWRLLQDDTAGQAVQASLSAGWGLQDQDNLQSTVMETLSALQAFELIRPLMNDSWLKQVYDYSHTLLATTESATDVEQMWLLALENIVAIVCDDESTAQATATRFRGIVDQMIHPEGYLKPMVVVTDGQTFQRQFLSVTALSLMAEASTQAGIDLWGYQNRDVSLNTAVTYLVYYYFYPEKWRWEKGLTEADTHQAFADLGAFMEFVTYRHYPRGVEMLLDDQRPFFSPYSGGLTTLTHSKTQKHKQSWF